MYEHCSRESQGAKSKTGPIYANFPNVVARDKALSAEALALLGLRATFKGGYAFNHVDAKRGITLSDGRHGIVVSRYMLTKLLRELNATPYFAREQSRPKPGSRRPGYAREEISLPTPDRGYRGVRRDWFDGSLTLKQIGCLMFVRANMHTYVEKIGARFGWPTRSAEKMVRELEKRGLVVSYRQRDPGTGQLGAKRICCAQKDAQAIYQNSSNCFSSYCFSSNTHNNNSSRNNNSHTVLKDK